MKNKTYGTSLQAGNSVKLTNQRDAAIDNIKNQSLSECDIIETMILRFPHLAENFFNELAIKDLKTCLNVSRKWSNFIQNEKFPWKS